MGLEYSHIQIKCMGQKFQNTGNYNHGHMIHSSQSSTDQISLSPMQPIEKQNPKSLVRMHGNDRAFIPKSLHFLLPACFQCLLRFTWDLYLIWSKITLNSTLHLRLLLLITRKVGLFLLSCLSLPSASVFFFSPPKWLASRVLMQICLDYSFILLKKIDLSRSCELRIMILKEFYFLCDFSLSNSRKYNRKLKF